MNQLSCQVSNCSNWDSGLCCLNKIIVEGPSAKNSSGTCCTSFASRKPGASNSTFVINSCASPDTKIKCEANNCVHNKNCKCGASDVNVGCCCSSPNSKSETECCTFKAK